MKIKWTAVAGFICAFYLFSGICNAESQDLPAYKLKGKLDSSRIGAGGHSFGAFTSQVIGGATIDIPGRGKHLSFRDGRVKAVLLMSPQGKYQMGLTPASWKKMTLPMMSTTGSLDKGAKGQGPEWRTEPFKNSPPGDKYHVYIEGADHFTFSAGQISEWLSRRRPARADQKELTEYVKIASTAFWDAYLKNNNRAKKYLQSDAIEEYSGNNVKLYRK